MASLQEDVAGQGAHREMGSEGFAAKRRAIAEQGEPVGQIQARASLHYGGEASNFRAGNAARKFLGIDGYVIDRLRRFLVKRAGRNLRAGRAAQWTREWFWGQGLHRLRGTVRYPQPSVLHEKAIAKPDAGKPHVRFDRGSVVPGALRVAPGH